MCFQRHPSGCTISHRQRKRHGCNQWNSGSNVPLNVDRHGSGCSSKSIPKDEKGKQNEPRKFPGIYTGKFPGIHGACHPCASLGIFRGYLRLSEQEIFRGHDIYHMQGTGKRIDTRMAETTLPPSSLPKQHQHVDAAQEDTHDDGNVTKR